MKASYVFAAVVVALAASVSARQLKTYVLIPGGSWPIPAPKPSPPKSPWGNLPGSSTGTIPNYPNQAIWNGVADAFCEDGEICDTSAKTRGVSVKFDDYAYSYSYAYSYATGSKGQGGTSVAAADAKAKGDNAGVNTFTRTGAFANPDGSAGSFAQTRGTAFAGDLEGEWFNPLGH